MKLFLSQRNTPVRGGVCLFTDDNGYAIDGGLYAELLENRNFEAKNAENGFEDDGGYAWSAFPEESSAALKVKTDRPLFPENPHYMRLTAEAGAGMKNKAYGGINLVKNREYKISFYARSYDYKGFAVVGVYDGGAVIGKKFKIKADGQWRKYSFRGKSKADAVDAEFRITLAKAGTVHLDCFSLIPSDAILGVFRRDVARLLKELKPAYLRFPCFTDSETGRSIWKYTVGQKERRKQFPNPHANAEFPCYGQTFGIGFYEYFLLAEYLGAKPLPSLNLTKDAEDCAQDALEMLEFANGKEDTLWGRLRAESGHHEPFGLDTFCVRGEKLTEAFETKVRKVCPDIGFIPDDERGESVGALECASRMIACESRGEIPEANCYVPALSRKNCLRDGRSLVECDGNACAVTADYYIRKLFGLFSGDRVLSAAAEGNVTVSATERDAFTFVKIVNPTAEEIEAEADGDYDFGALTQILRLDGDRITDVAPTGARTFTLSPRSFHVLLFKK